MNQFGAIVVTNSHPAACAASVDPGPGGRRPGNTSGIRASRSANPECFTTPMLRSQDLAAANVLALPDMSSWTYTSLAARLELSASETHAAFKRAGMAGLLLGRTVDRVPSSSSYSMVALRLLREPGRADARGARRRAGYPPASWLRPSTRSSLPRRGLSDRPPTARRAATLWRRSTAPRRQPHGGTRACTRCSH